MQKNPPHSYTVAIPFNIRINSLKKTFQVFHWFYGNQLNSIAISKHLYLLPRYDTH